MHPSGCGNPRDPAKKRHRRIKVAVPLAFIERKTETPTEYQAALRFRGAVAAAFSRPTTCPATWRAG